MENDTTPPQPELNSTEPPPLAPHTTQKTADDNPPLYISGFGVMGQSTPDVATGSTPVTRRDD